MVLDFWLNFRNSFSVQVYQQVPAKSSIPGIWNLRETCFFLKRKSVSPKSHLRFGNVRTDSYLASTILINKTYYVLSTNEREI